jgi:hypothetical protein
LADLCLAYGHLLVYTGPPENAVPVVERNLEDFRLAREGRDPIWEARDLCSLGSLAEATDDLAEAEQLYRQSLAVASERELGPELAEAELALGRLLSERLDRRAEGCPLLVEAARHFDEMGMPEAEEVLESTDLPHRFNLRIVRLRI